MVFKWTQKGQYVVVSHTFGPAQLYVQGVLRQSTVCKVSFYCTVVCFQVYYLHCADFHPNFVRSASLHKPPPPPPGKMKSNHVCREMSAIIHFS